MRLASYVLSFCLHAAIFLLIWFWPSSPPIKLDTPPVMISLVEGATGGNRTPSPILGHMGQPSDGPLAPTPPAPKAEIAAPERAEVKEPKPVPPQPKQDAAEVKKPEPKPEPKPQPKPEPKEEAKPIAQKKEEKPKPKEEPPKEAPKDQKKPEPPKPDAKAEAKKDAKESKDAKSNVDPVAAALQQARKATSRAESGDRGNAVEQALAQAQRRAGGNRGGGLGDVYMGQVMLAVRPNWGFASAARVNLRCIINVKVDGQGKLLQQPTITHSSGNSQFDASAASAIVRTANSGQFPPPPSADYGDLDLVFTLDELMGR